MLTRIYGLAFETKGELDAYLIQRAEAEKRDHKKLGKELGLFTVSNLVGKGLPMLLPKGNIIKTGIRKFYKKRKRKIRLFFCVNSAHRQKRTLYQERTYG